jgi:hypothetical protein
LCNFYFIFKELFRNGEQVSQPEFGEYLAVHCTIDIRVNMDKYISKYEKPKTFLEAQLELAFKFVFFFWRRVKDPLRTFIFDIDRALFAVQDGDFSTDFC